MAQNIDNENISHSLTDILSMLMKECDIDDADLSRQTGVPASTISRMRIHSNANPTASTLRPIAKFFDISISQLLGDETLPLSRIPGTHNPTPFTASRVPIIEWNQIYKWKNEGMDAFKGKLNKWISTERKVGRNVFALVVPTDSLGLAFRKGSLLISDPNVEPNDGDLVLIKFENEPTILFRQILKDGADFYIRSVNLELKGTKLLEGNYEFLGMVIETRYSPIESLSVATQPNKANSPIAYPIGQIQEV